MSSYFSYAKSEKDLKRKFKSHGFDSSKPLDRAEMAIALEDFNKGKHAMRLETILAFEDELSSINKHGSATKALGALGGGLAALHGGLKEWDSRSAENRALQSTPEPQRQEAQQYVNASRKHRLRRLGVNAALAAGSGALVGHYGTKAAKGLSSAVSQAAIDKLKPAVDDTIRGSFWKAVNPFKKKK